LKILFAAPEMVPFCKTGGLADVTGSLAPVLASLGHEVHVVMPGYAAIDRAKFGFREGCARFQIAVGPVSKPVTISSAAWKGVHIHLVENEEYFDRPGFYGDEHGDYLDNGPRFVLFCRGVLEAAKCLGIAPDIIHAHDWQAGLVSPSLRTLYAGEEAFRRTKSVFTIHNLGYQGIFPRWVFGLSGIPESEFDWRKMEYYGSVSFLKSGIVYADAVTTVSRTYAREITTEPLGFGLQGVLAERRGDLSGILNGIDTEEWNPATDADIPARFGPDHPEGRKVCRKSLLASFGVKAGADTPLFGMVSRLDSQKGFDLLAEAMGRIMTLDMRLLVLGSGTAEYREALSGLASANPDRIGLALKFDPAAAKLVYAGSDAFLMPSRYEPCGLGQMIALRYGSLPVVHATGGLADTVTDLDSDPATGNGFSFGDYSADALALAVKRAAAAFRERGRPRWRAAMERGMRADFSWRRSTAEYLALYEKLPGAFHRGK
jgi:starch synthase